GRGRVVAQLEHALSPDLIVSSRTRFIHDDHLGSTDLVTDEQGVATQYLSHDVWGRPRDPDDWTAADDFSQPQVARAYTGHDAQTDFGLIHMGGRLYDPLLGRMINADPVIPDGLRSSGWNRHAYVLNDPLSQIDPSGFNPEALADWSKQEREVVGSDGSKVTIGSGINPDSGNFEYEVVVEGQQDTGPATDAGPGVDGRGAEGVVGSGQGSTAEDVALGVVDGAGNVGAGMFGAGAMALCPPATIVVVGGYWATGGNPFGTARQFVGDLLDSDLLSRNPDSTAYEASRITTEIVAGATAGIARGVQAGARSALGRALGSCSSSCGAAAEQGAAPVMEAALDPSCFPAGTQV
ncbi:MAG: RHS repeat-associated core domain-containing protein, partial [Myxococcales bacterium]|nr:RHS repeat-associated core domain-containing protein [Myxococcales bacterium]